MVTGKLKRSDYWPTHIPLGARLRCQPPLDSKSRLHNSSGAFTVEAAYAKMEGKQHGHCSSEDQSLKNPLVTSSSPPQPAPYPLSSTSPANGIAAFRSLPPSRHQPWRLCRSVCEGAVIATAIALILIVLTSFYRPSFSPLSAILPRTIFHSPKLDSARFRLDGLIYALSDPTLHCPDEMLAPLRSLNTELSQYGHKNDCLNAHLNIDLLPPIRAAADTGHCSLFQRILPAVAMAQNYTREVVNSLNASLALCVEALSAAEMTRTEVEREIVNNDKVAGFGRVLPDCLGAPRRRIKIRFKTRKRGRVGRIRSWMPCGTYEMEGTSSALSLIDMIDSKRA
jgi:hypothetical protein